jgi:hypothetical protein
MIKEDVILPPSDKEARGTLLSTGALSFSVLNLLLIHVWQHAVLSGVAAFSLWIKNVLFFLGMFGG